jgi:Zn ribbon nucleic-acid-binding protein
VTEWYYDLQYTGEHKVEPFRCVQCGHRVDPVILQNQIRLPVMSHAARQVRHRYSLKSDTLGEEA